MKKLQRLLLTLAFSLCFSSAMAGGEAAQDPHEAANRLDYQIMLEEAEQARVEAEIARREAEKAAERAREMMKENQHRLEDSARKQQLTEQQKLERAAEREEMEKAREELSRAHRELRKASREVAKAHRDLSRSDRSIRITQTVNLGDRAVIGIVLGKQTDRGVEVIGVSPDGPAERAGLEQGDVLVSVKGVDLANNDEARQALFEVMDKVEDGEELQVIVDRDGQIGEYTVIAEQREPHSWQSVIRLPEITVSPGDLETGPMIIEQIEIEEIDEEALAARLSELTEKLETKKFLFTSDDHEFIEEFEFEDFSEFGGHAMSDANVWFGLPHAHGLELAPVDANLGTYFNTDRGVLVIRAREGNTYQLESGDVILSVAGTGVNAPSDLLRALRHVEPGTDISIEIKRDLKDKTLNVVVPENRLGNR